ncbi:MAG: calcium-binding protein [Pseudomonadota bacterium]
MTIALFSNSLNFNSGLITIPPVYITDFYATVFQTEHRDVGYTSHFYGHYGDNVFYGDNGVDHMYGGGGLDRLFGGGGNDHQYGGASLDDLFGGAGNDHQYGGNYSDLIFGGIGNDFQYGGTGNDRIEGGDGDDFQYGGDGNDWMAGDSDEDHLFGGAGNDIMYGGGENDWMDGGTGDDAHYGGAGGDLIRGSYGADYIDGGAGVNIVDYSASTEGVYVNLISGKGYFGLASGDTFVNIHYVWGSKGADQIIGDDKNNYIIGGDGADTLSGGDGHDRIVGGQNGPGFRGGDVMRGGAGDDSFDFKAPYESGAAAGSFDVIQDFDLYGDDTMRFNVSQVQEFGWTVATAVLDTRVGTLVTIEDRSGDAPAELYQVFLENTAESSIAVDDFDFY